MPEPTIAERFLAMHHEDTPFLIPNPWDPGAAKLLVSLGFRALATTSSGHAATLGKLDGSVTRDEALAHATAMAGAVDVPVSADLERGYADDPPAVADTIRLAARTGLAGCSIEDSTGNRDDPIYDAAFAAERIAAAADAAHTGATKLVLTARAENFLYGRTDLADTIDRLQRFSAAGADVLYAPGLSSLDDIRTLVAEVDKPVNVIARPGAPTVAELADAGVARISVGGALAWVALAAVVDAAHELLDQGTYGFLARVSTGRDAARAAFT